MNKQRQALIRDIYTEINRGTIVKDEKLFTERELCEYFHVNRSLLREALVALETLGVIDIRERQGTFLENKPTKMLSDSLDFMNEYSPTLLHDQSIEARMIIEPKTARMAAQNCTPQQADILRSEIQFLYDLYDNEKMDIQEKATLAYRHNIIIHNTITEIAGNTVLANIYRYLGDLSRNIFSSLGRSPSGFQPYALWPDILIEEHKNIVDAIVRHDCDGAEKAMYDHLQNSKIRNSRTMPGQSLTDDSEPTFRMPVEL